MERKKFNPQDWLNTQTPPQEHAPLPDISTDLRFAEVERILQIIEAKGIDITTPYTNWRDVGFAFADAFGENGRSFFHRVSRFHFGYSEQDCNKQFDYCLKSKGQGITLKTFFHIAKSAGVDIGFQQSVMQAILPPEKEKPAASQELADMPTFPESLFPQLPQILKEVVSIADSNEERDILLLGSLGVFSACLPKVSGIYAGKRVYANLFLYIVAMASGGKGRLVHCRQLVNLIHKELREQAKLHKQHYELELAEYNAKKGKEEGIEKPGKPPEKVLFIPANNSSTGAYQLLGDSDGRGLIFETEGDTLALAFKSDYGNYSDGFRKAFHHETISYYRRTDREFVDIENPCLSTVLSGTPKQVPALIPDAENGLFSRFIFYTMNTRPEWKDVFANPTDNGLDDHFEALGVEFYALYKFINGSAPVQFSLTPDQMKRFNPFFENIQAKYLNLQRPEYVSTIRRLGLIAFRFCMIFSALRILETGDTSQKLICEEQDFQTSLAMIRVLVQHASKVFSELPHEESPQSALTRKEKFLHGLPYNFNRQKYLDIATALNIPAKTAEGYITGFVKNKLVHRESQDNYINTSVEETQETKDVEENEDG